MAMANSKGSSNIRNLMYPGKPALLPPRSPFPSVSSAYVDYFIPTPLNASKAMQKPRDVQPHHQRTASESFLIEEQPSWLDDLLNEPETPVRRGGHRRSSSDSFAYLDVGNLSRQDYVAQEEYKPRNLTLVPSWKSQDFDRSKEGWRAPPYAEAQPVKQKNRTAERSSSAVVQVTGLPSSRDDVAGQNSGLSSAPQEAGRAAKQKQGQGETSSVDSKASSDNRDASHAKPSASDTDAKRAKQQFAQRSRVRKLQYIAELERNVQALQAEGSEVTAELKFLNQQNLILSMENKALKHRLESLAQEQMIKCFEHEVLEREIGRLRALYQQQHQPHQQQQKQPSSSHRRSTSKDLDSQFASLSLKHKDQSLSPDKVSGPFHI
ncbi:uncharacterized protein At4g06598 isoform X1 [Punica granatum]|uniref:Uncharacterized protein At4g06598 isoform X1 n=1 Tax=Punica granatum TaxID=22663 RepID=A0A6P8CHK4_PUNGR|nr:uncharacterized protein At4g06598 isoform X1 [Punica granatum]XP_031380938.1 uncharacterized protein At4g06598 isoform X1 [Punica granatum]